MLLDEKASKDYLKKMRSQKMEALKKAELMKKIVQRCTAMASSKKAVKCSRCGYMSGLFLSFPLTSSTLMLWCSYPC